MSEFDSIEEELKFMADCSDDRGDSETSLMFVRYLAHIRKLNAELAALKAGQGEAVAWRYTSSQSFGRSDRKWHYQESFPHAGNRAVLEIGKLEALYLDPPASADAVPVPRELLRRVVTRVILRSQEDAHADACDELRALLAQSESEVRP